MALRVGQVLQGRKAAYELLEPLKGRTVFKAKSPTTHDLPKAVVKCATADNERFTLRREYTNYQLNEEPTTPPHLVFEWMDTDLRSLSADIFRSNRRVLKTVSKAVLSGLEVLKTLDAVHTNVSINNVFVSNFHDASPIAKLGDLGNVVLEGDTQRVQSLPCRAPEVWKGSGCKHVSDVWSLGVTLAHRPSPVTIFGQSNKLIEGHTEAWCTAKLIRLVGPLGPPVDCEQYQDEFELAEELERIDHPYRETKLIEQRTIREELEKLSDPPVSPELLDFIGYLLVVDHTKRPTASEALNHPYLQNTDNGDDTMEPIRDMEMPDDLVVRPG